MKRKIFKIIPITFLSLLLCLEPAAPAFAVTGGTGSSFEDSYVVIGEDEWPDRYVRGTDSDADMPMLLSVGDDGGHSERLGTLNAMFYYWPTDDADPIGISDINARLAEKYSSTSAPAITVAVIDTGINTNLPVFKDRLVMVDGNDFTSSSPASIEDNFGHGTFVSGIIADMTPDNVRIMPLKVSNGRYINSIDIIDAVICAADNGADIINLSIGGYTLDSAYQEACEYALNAGCIVVAASGNENNYMDKSKCYPACYDGVVAVGAMDGENTRSYFSNYGKYVSLSAPGSDIYGYDYKDNTGVREKSSGTSFSAPMVSGAMALVKLLGYDISTGTFMSNESIENCLFANSLDRGDDGRDDYFGYGKLNLADLDINAGINSTYIKAGCITTTEAGIATSGSAVYGMKLWKYDFSSGTETLIKSWDGDLETDPEAASGQSLTMRLAGYSSAGKMYESSLGVLKSGGYTGLYRGKPVEKFKIYLMQGTDCIDEWSVVS